MSVRLLVSSFLLVCVFGASIAAAEEAPRQWPSFLGQGADLLQADTLPLTWSPTENIAWEQAIAGHGQSSPVIFGERVFVTSLSGPQKEKLHVTAFSLSDGKELWTHTADSTAPQKNSLYISRAAPTPVLDAQHMYAYFESGDVVCLTHEGKPIWSKSLSKEYGEPKNEFGLSASPVLWQEHLIVLIDDEGPSYLVALDKATGDILWKTDRKSRVSWSSPALVQVEQQTHLVVSSAGSVDGYDPASGELLWSYDDVGGNTSNTPLDVGGGRFLIGGSPGQRGENAEAARRSNGLMQIEKVDGQWQAKLVWKQDEAMSSFASPVAHDGYAYWLNRAGVLFCFDLQSGEQQYAERIEQTAWATPLAVGNRVYIFGKSGLTSVVAAGPKFEVLAQNELWDTDNPPPDNSLTVEETDPDRRRAAATFSGPTLYGAAAVDGSLVLRIGNRAYCLRAQN